MSEQNASAGSPSPAECTVTDVTSGSVSVVLDAPRSPIAAPGQLPTKFRNMLSLKIAGNRASGSAQYSLSQLQRALATHDVQLPLVVVDLRQEPHGFIHVAPPLLGEDYVAIGWYAERDWLNVGKGGPSIAADEIDRLEEASKTSNLVLLQICTKTAEDGIATAKPHTAQPAGDFYSERTLLTSMLADVDYVRFPTTDHCRPRDAEVQDFVAFELALPAGTWVHFHCRGGDGRTTIFMAMHDIMHNAPADPLSAILARQRQIGGSDLSGPSGKTTSFAYPFDVERRAFVQSFYQYVCAAKPGGFTLPWSVWVAEKVARL
jgi:Inositol hexakisphosphate